MSPAQFGSWVRIAFWRRIVLLLLITVPTFFASGYMAYVLPHRGTTRIELAIVIFFTLLFGWISIGFWTTLVGFLMLVRRFHRFSIPAEPVTSAPKMGVPPRTAILMPICNEDTSRILAGLKTIYKSVELTGRMEQFSFFILSDTNDPDVWVEEELGWAHLCRSLNAFGRIFYRRRRVNIKRKSGNIADFCRRWGRDFKYMIVLDADSIMSGATMVRMVEIMEQHLSVGILQTVPKGQGRMSLIARVQQFSNNVYGPLFAAGLHFWQLGDAHYWGHNAIIRVEPFMKNCLLSRLSGKPPLGGDILSHDFVEAALMRRGGWAVWLAYDLEGSYEEMPPTLLDELKRDRRWCQGNLQHLRLLFTKGLCPVHRALFLNGVMSYMSALLWCIFLCLSTAEAIYEVLRKPVYFTKTKSLFPNWPVWHPEWSIALLFATALILFMPKLLSIMLILCHRGKARLFGGPLKLILSVVVESILATFLAPVRMLSHSRFVLLTLLGRQIGWSSQPRDDRGTTWREAIRYHGGSTLLAIVWGIVVFIVNRTFFWWLTPIIVALACSIPLSVLTSRASLGRALLKLGLLRIPEEATPPQELRWLQSNIKEQRGNGSTPLPGVRGFARAVIDPFVNNLHIVLLRKDRKISPRIAKRRQKLRDKALILGPHNLTPSQKIELLYDPACMAALHRAVWELPSRTLAAEWGLT